MKNETLTLPNKLEKYLKYFNNDWVLEVFPGIISKKDNDGATKLVSRSLLIIFCFSAGKKG